jgi:hypothetical protein
MEKLLLPQKKKENKKQKRKAQKIQITSLIEPPHKNIN